MAGRLPTWTPLLPRAPGRRAARRNLTTKLPRDRGLMTYSYTQLSQYLACPRRYRHHYLDGWREKEERAAMIFGRVFEAAVAAYFRHEDCAATLVQDWSVYRSSELEYKAGDSWEAMLRQGL